MATVFDVAKYILEKQGELTTMKLQKLVYYSQAWHVIWEEVRLFGENIEAWINGPVVPDLYQLHQGMFRIKAEDVNPGSSDNLSDSEKESIDSVIDFYGSKSSQWLSDLTHAEAPWIDARKGLANNERGSREITIASMAEYYTSPY